MAVNSVLIPMVTLGLEHCVHVSTYAECLFKSFFFPPARSFFQRSLDEERKNTLIHHTNVTSSFFSLLSLPTDLYFETFGQFIFGVDVLHGQLHDS